jgi:hypothetical protein
MNNTQAKWITAASALFISGLIFLFLPSEIYLRNPLEFISTPAQLIRNLSFGALLLGTGLILPVLLPFGRWQRTYAILIGSLSLALWISSVFLVADLGELDGASFDLTRHGRILTYHTGWFALAFVAGCFGMWKRPLLMMGVLGVIGSGLILIMVSNFYRVSQSKDANLEPVSLTDIARFSSERNLLILVMDTFQSDVLDVIARQDPTVRTKLDGFQFYPDTLGVAPSTYLTMPAFHSGEKYNQMMSLQEFYELGVREGSFLAELAQNGYQVDIVNPIASACPDRMNICKHQENLLLHEEQVTLTEAFRLADLGFLRAIPGLLKIWAFEGTSGPVARIRSETPLTGLEHRIFQGNTVQKLIADNLWVDNGPPTAKLVHLLNTHPPFMFDADCEFIGVTSVIDRSHMTDQTVCALRWFDYLLESMRASGVYDNSMIILAADTGAGSIYGMDDLSSLYAGNHGMEPGEFGRLIGGANPVLAIKYPDAHGPLQKSQVSAQLTDIARTVCENLQDCTKEHGLNLRSSEAGVRERTYLYYVWQHDYWGLDKIPGIIEYTVRGPLWQRSSWTREIPSALPAQISRVAFSDEDNPQIFGMGWGEVEVNKNGISKRWSIAQRAELFLPLPTGNDLVLSFRLMSAPGLLDQTMKVSVNGKVIDSRNLESRVVTATITLPAELIEEPVSEIVLEFSEIKKPESADDRSVSVSFYELNIFQAPE